jgi:broad specificity phosphatase PhoE
MTLQGAAINARPSVFARARMRLVHRTRRHAPAKTALRIILVRHGRPAISSGPRTSHGGFADYIDAYEAAGLDPTSAPPEELQDLAKGLTAVFVSSRPRSQESAKAIAPHAELIADSLFEEAPLASPKIPLIKLGVPAWAVMSRILWHAGYHPEIENYRKAKQRAKAAADILIFKAQEDGGTSVLVAHGYFNAIIGRELARRGFQKTGSHRVHFWNAVVYELS